MNNGCVCCTVRGDPVRILGGLMKRRDRFDGIIVETTGLADPAPVVQTFFVDEDVRRSTRLDSIVTVVDAKHLPQRLADSPEAEEQIAFADLIVLNKMDLVTPEQADEDGAQDPRHQPHRRDPPRHPIGCADRGSGESDAFNLERILEREPAFLEDGGAWPPRWRGGLDVLPDGSPDRPRPASRPGSPACCSCADRTSCVSRAFLFFPGEERRFAFQAVHMIADGDFISPQARQPRTSRIVFIGRNLNRPQLRAAFEECMAAAKRASPSEMSLPLREEDSLLARRGFFRDTGAWVVAVAFGRDGRGCFFAWATAASASPIPPTRRRVAPRGRA